jgi:hypothetical protein
VAFQAAAFGINGMQVRTPSLALAYYLLVAGVGGAAAYLLIADRRWRLGFAFAVSRGR